MSGRRRLEKTISCDDWSSATINLHITKSDRKKIKRIKGESHAIINPNRIGIDFDNFENGSHNFIPNLTPADVIQLINRLDILRRDYIREALRKGTISHKFAVELDSRRKVDFDIGYCSQSGNEELRMYYEDRLRDIDRFEIGRIDISLLPKLTKALKEIFVEYNHYMNRALLLKEII